MEIKAESVYNYESYKRFNKFNMFKSKNPGRRKKIYILINVFAFLICLLNLIIEPTESSIMLFAIILLMCFLMFFMYFLFPKVTFKSYKNLVGVKNDFVFRDNDFTMTSENALYNGNSVMKYEALYKVYETPNYFYFYISIGQAYIVEKATITNGSANDLRAILSKNLPPKKFIITK